MSQALLDELVRGVLASGGYAFVGVVVLTFGYGVLDALTPGNLRSLVYTDHNRNAAILVSANVLAIATIITTAILTSADDLTDGLIESAVYGMVGVLLLAASFKLIDVLTPGRLGDLVTSVEHTPLVYVTASFQLALGAVLAAAIS